MVHSSWQERVVSQEPRGNTRTVAPIAAAMSHELSTMSPRANRSGYEL